MDIKYMDMLFIKSTESHALYLSRTGNMVVRFGYKTRHSIKDTLSEYLQYVNGSILGTIVVSLIAYQDITSMYREGVIEWLLFLLAVAYVFGVNIMCALSIATTETTIRMKRLLAIDPESMRIETEDAQQLIKGFGFRTYMVILALICIILATSTVHVFDERASYIAWAIYIVRTIALWLLIIHTRLFQRMATFMKNKEAKNV